MAGADRVERLTNLLALLLETARPLTLVEIIGELEGQYAGKESTRRAAFERDKAALREIGVPIETTVLTGGQAGMSAYWIDRDRYELTDLHLEADEMRALQVAVAAVRPTQGREALWKLGLDTIDGDAAGDVAVTATVPELPGLPALRDASARRRTVTFALPRQAAAPRPVRAAAAHRLLVRRRARPRARRAADVPRRSHRGRRDDRRGRRRSSDPPGVDLRTAFPSDPKELGGDGGSGAVAVVRVDAGARRRRGARARRRPRAAAPRRTARSTSRCPAPTCRRSGRGCSGCSTTPRSSGRPTCGPPSSAG